MSGIEHLDLGNDEDELPAISDSGRLSHWPPTLQLILTIMLTIVIYSIVGVITGKVIQSAYGISAADMFNNIDQFLEEHGHHLNPYRWMQIMSTISIFGLSALVVSYLFTGRMLGLFDFNKSANFKSLVLVPLIIFLAFPIITLVYVYVSQFPVPEALVELEEAMERFTTALLSDDNNSIFLLNFVMIAILPAICEELLFRGVIQRLTTKAFNSHHIGILLTGLFFGLIHGQVFKFLPIAVLGILLGYLYWWTKNLWFPIFAHFFHNGIQVVIYFAVAKGWMNTSLDSPEMVPPMMTAMFAVLFVGVMYLFYNGNIKTANESI